MRVSKPGVGRAARARGRELSLSVDLIPSCGEGARHALPGFSCMIR